MPDNPPETSASMPLPPELEEKKRTIMEALGYEKETDWDELIEESRDTALETITEEDDTPVDLADLSNEQVAEAVVNYLFAQYVEAQPL